MRRQPITHRSCSELSADSRLRKVFESPVPAVVIFPVSHAVGLSVIRTLTGHGIPLLAVDFKGNSAGLFSRDVVPLLLPTLNRDQGTFIEGVLSLGACFREKPVLFLVDDEDLFLSLQRADLFERYYRLPLSPWSIVEPIVDKGRLYRTCQERNFPIPTTWFVSVIRDLDRQRAGMSFPCIVKPTFSTRFRQRFGIKAKHFDAFEPLRDYAQLLLREGIEFVAQEFVEGPMESLYTYAAYSDGEGNVLSAFMGRKVHQFPPDFGTCRLGESVDEPELEELGRELLRILRYRGISLTEFKRDPKGNFKLMELNPRPGDWPERLAQVCGANLVLTAYRASLGERIEPHRASRVGVKWANLAEDLYYCVRGYRLLGYPEEHRGVLGWLRDLKGLEAEAFFSWRDPLPAWVRLKGMIRDFAARERNLRARG